MRNNSHLRHIPYLVFADETGSIIEDERYEAVGRSGRDAVRLSPQDFIELPQGSEFFFLPGRKPYGFNKENGEIEIYPEGKAVAVFISPAHTQTYLAAYEKEPKAPILPLYAYSAVGWLDGKFYTTAVRIDPDVRQDFEQFNLPSIKKR